MVLEITKNNRNEFSQREETQRFNRLCKTFGDMNIADIKASHVVKWQNDCGFAPKTIRNDLCKCYFTLEKVTIIYTFLKKILEKFFEMPCFRRFKWRTVRDSNPRYPLGYAPLAGVWFQPTHPTVLVEWDYSG